MNSKPIKIFGLVLTIFFCMIKTNEVFARETIQYQLYRLSDDPSDDRRPKLAINDPGTVWVVWESDRDGDLDLYGKRFDNGVWSTLFEIVQDTNITFLCNIFFQLDSTLLLFGTETKPIDRYSVSGDLFYEQWNEESFSDRQKIAFVHHDNPYSWSANGIPQIGRLQQNLIACYHREFKFSYSSWHDSLFLKIYYNNIWQPEKCDTVFLQESKGSFYDVRFFRYEKVNLSDKVIFLIQEFIQYAVYMGGGVIDIGLIINDGFETFYDTLNTRWGREIVRTSYNYGSDRNSIFCGGELQKTNVTIFRKININEEHKAIIQREWNYIFTDNLNISQMSDLVAFVWSDSANIYVKTFQDSTWYETLEIPLTGLTHIEHSLKCAVYDNQQIWVAFDAIYNGNRDVYALSVPASFVVDTVMTSVKQQAENKAFSNDHTLFQNYPNPFNSSTTIKYQLPDATEVKLEIFNLIGQRIRTVVDQFQIPGSYLIRWDGTDDFNQPVASGVYLYQFES